MECNEVDRLLDGYLDGELEPAQQGRLEQHLTACIQCRALTEELRRFRSLFRASAPVYTAPPELKTRILTAVRRERHRNLFALWRQPWAYVAALIILSVSLGWRALFLGAGNQIASQAVFDHSRALLVGQLLDIASDDPQVVKPWFTTKLNFSPPVADLASAGFSLLGGRIDAIQNRLVSAVVYKRGKDLVTLFAWPVKTERLADADWDIGGYNVCTWAHSGLNCVVVSALSDRELDEFVDLIRKHAK